MYRRRNINNLKINKIMGKSEKWFNGFMVGFLVGGIVGIFILDLIKKGII